MAKLLFWFVYVYPNIDAIFEHKLILDATQIKMDKFLAPYKNQVKIPWNNWSFLSDVLRSASRV